MSNQNAIDLLFQVEGQGSLTGKTGNLIVSQLKEIVQQINSGASSVPKIELDVGVKSGAIDAITKELNAIGKGSNFKKISSELVSVRKMLLHIMTGIGSSGATLQRILNSMPESADMSTKSIKEITSSITELVSEIDRLSDVVSNIGNKPANVSGSIVDPQQMSLIATKAKETKATFESLYDTVHRYANLDTAGAISPREYSSFGSPNKLSKLMHASASAKPQEYEQLIEELLQWIEAVNTFGQHKIQLPDMGKLESATKALNEYKTQDTTQGSNATDNSSILEKAQSMSESCQKIEDTLTTLRQKIESTFDLSTVNTNADKIKAEIEAISEKLPEIKAAASQIAQGGATDTGSEDNVNSYQKLKAAITEYYKMYTQLSKASHRDGSLVKEGASFRDVEKYHERIEILNRSIQTLNQYGIQPRDDGVISFAESTEELQKAAEAAGVSLQQMRSLVVDVDKLTNNMVASVEKDATQSSVQNWNGVVQQAKNRLKQLNDVGAQLNSSEVATKMKEVEDLIKAGAEKLIAKDGKNVDVNQVTADIEKLKKVLLELNGIVIDKGADKETWLHKMSKTFGGHLRTALAGLITVNVSKYLRQVADNVIKLDRAVTDLQIATGKSREETKELVAQYSKLAKQLSVTTAEVANAADAWLRQGYSIAEVNELIEASTMLSKLGQIDSAEASKALTSALQGYKLSAEDAISVTDKLTAVDMEAAISAGGIATAMAETATSAKLAGVEMDTLIGYIAKVAEVTQDSEESVGTFYKTLFARMNNVAAGKFVDDETGEELNDVETVLNELGIALRDTNGLFRDTKSVLDEVAAGWVTFNNVEQHAIATAIAGTRQQEKFIVLMENYGDALKYAETSANSAGTAQEKYAAYSDGIEAALNRLTAAWESFSQEVLSSELVIFLVDALTDLANALTKIASIGNGVIPAIVGITAAMLTLSTVVKAVSASTIPALTALRTAFIGALKDPVVWVSVLTSIAYIFKDDMNEVAQSVIGGLVALGATFGVVALAIKAHAVGISATIMSIPIFGWIVAAIELLLAAVALLVSGINKWRNQAAKQREEALKMAEALQKQADATREIAEASKEAAKKVEELIDKFKEAGAASDSLLMYEALQGIGEEVASLYDVEMSPLEAINTLLGEQYSYQELIQTVLDGNLDVLSEIESKMREIQKRNIQQQITDQANAAEQLSDAYGSHTIKDGDADWGAGTNKELAVSEAANLFADGRHGITVTGDASSVKVKIHGDNISEQVAYLQEAEAAFRERYKFDTSLLTGNAIYEYIKTALSELQNSANLLDEAKMALAENVASTLGTKVELIEGTTQKEWNEAVQALSDDIKNDEAIQEAFAGNLDEVAQYAEQYLIQKFPKIFSNLNKYIGAKDIVSVLDGVEGKFDILSKAMEEMSDQGMLTASTFKTIKQEFPDLVQYLKETANGVILVDDAMSHFVSGEEGSYIKAIEDAASIYNTALAEYEQLSNPTTEQYNELVSKYNSYKNAVENAQKYLTVERMLTSEQIKEQYVDVLNDEIEALEKQEDAYAELCDWRKELLQTYQEELDYQKKLQKQQRSVADLQTKLAVARLDNSEAGRARVRELENQLAEAEEELEDITLEHAIDQVTKEIEASQSENAARIQAAVDALKGAIEASARTTAEALAQELETKGITPVVNVNINGALAGGIGKHTDDNGSFNVTLGVDKPSEGSDQFQNDSSGAISLSGALASGNTEIIGKYGDDVLKGFVDGQGRRLTDRTSMLPNVYNVRGAGYHSRSDDGLDDIGVALNDSIYELKVGTEETGDIASGEILTDLNDAYSDLPIGAIVAHNGDLYMKSAKNQYATPFWGKIMSEYEDYDAFKNAYLAALNSVETHHTGGFAGDVSTLSSSEVFAKLLKGEFVSTPAQMQRFMTETLPAIAGFDTNNSSNEFNAPLISIQCDNVTSDSLPGLEKVVKEAVKEVKKQLDDGMRRKGFKNTRTKMPI